MSVRASRLALFLLLERAVRNMVLQRRATRRAVLRWSLASLLGLSVLPSAAAAEEVSTPPLMDDWPFLNAIGGPVWATTIGETAVRRQPNIADNRFGVLRAGTPLQILSTSGDWKYVFNPHTQGTAYVASSLLAPGGRPS